MVQSHRTWAASDRVTSMKKRLRGASRTIGDLLGMIRRLLWGDLNEGGCEG